MRIRSLVAADFFSLMEYDWSPLIAERDTIYLILARDHGRCGLVAEDDAGTPVGYLLGARSADGRSMFLFHVHVRAEHRSGGVGTRLMSRIEQVAREDGVETIWLLARREVRCFYTRMGYEEPADLLPPALCAYVRRTKAAHAMCKRVAASGVQRTRKCGEESEKSDLT